MMHDAPDNTETGAASQPWNQKIYAGNDALDDEAGLPCAPAADSPVWRQVLENVPMGLALLDAETGETLWINPALRVLLKDGIGVGDVVQWQPYEYLPDMEPASWEGIWQRAVSAQPTEVAPLSGRVQFVHHAERSIGLWEWGLQRLDDAMPRSFLLSVQDVTEIVMNERQLATAGRTAQTARRRAETLSELVQLVNESLTTPDLLRAITHAAARYFETPHASVLLLAPDGEHFQVGYSVGLQAHADALPEGRADGDSIVGLTCNNTLAGRAIADRETLRGIHRPGIGTMHSPACRWPRASHAGFQSHLSGRPHVWRGGSVFC